MAIDMEIWKSIKDWPEYEISNFGNVRSVASKPGVRKSGRILCTSVEHVGHLRVRLSREWKRYPKLVHRLVADAFIPKVPGKKYVLHKDGNPQNNHVSNLKWGTAHDNSQDMIAHGRSLKGIKNRAAKLTENDVRKIRELYSYGVPNKKIRELYKIHKNSVLNIINGKTWSHVI